MKSLFRNSFVRSLVLAGAMVCGATHAGAAYVISEATGFITPSFRGESGSTYFGWSNGTIGSGGVTVNGTPSINPAALSGSSFLTQAGSNDIVSSTNNIYSSVGGVNTALLTLSIPTSGVVGIDGFTTIIIQATGFGSFGFPLDTFAFGTIDGVSPTFEYGANGAAGNPGQSWVKFEIPGNAASYDVDITGYSAGAGVLSVTSLIVDTYFSSTSFATDAATAVPEPSMALLGVSALGLLSLRRSRK